MNSKSNFTNNSGTGFNWLLAALALCLTVPARAETRSAAIPFTDIGAGATAGYQGAALGVAATASGARLHCGFQKLEGQATPEGLWLESTKPGGAGRLRLIATALCRSGLSTLNPQPSTVLPATGTVSVQDKLVWFKRPGLTEEYSVSVDGVRQDFVIESAPLNPQRSTLTQSAGDLRVELALSGARAEATAYGARLRLEGSGRVLAYSRLRVEDATGRKLAAHLEVLSADRLAVSVADANATYPVRIDPTFSDADWVSLNPGLPGANGHVLAIAVDSSGNVYAGGEFNFAGTVPANHIAKWDGRAWSALGSGMDRTVTALLVSGTNLYAGGYFSTASGAPVNSIAKWDGSAWSALGSGAGSYVYALAVSGTDLYAGGSFSFGAAGGVPTRGIAKWDGNTWSALGSGMDSYVYALAADGAGHLFVGGQFSLAGTNVSPFIAQANLGSTPTIITPAQSQTAEIGTTVDLSVDAAGGYLTYQLLFNGTNLLSCGTDSCLELTNVNPSQSGTYTVLVTNVFGAVTSGPAMLNVIPAVERRPVPGVQVMGESGSLYNMDYAASLRPAPNWTTLGSVSLTSTPQYYFDLTLPLPPQRSYRVWQTGTLGVIPSLNLHIVPAITLTGNMGGSVRVDAINQFGPIDAWFTLDTVTLTNTPQLYFDVTAWKQPQRLYRLVPLP